MSRVEEYNIFSLSIVQFMVVNMMTVCFKFLKENACQHGDSTRLAHTHTPSTCTSATASSAAHFTRRLIRHLLLILVDLDQVSSNLSVNEQIRFKVRPVAITSVANLQKSGVR